MISRVIGSCDACGKPVEANQGARDMLALELYHYSCGKEIGLRFCTECWEWMPVDTEHAWDNCRTKED